MAAKRSTHWLLEGFQIDLRSLGLFRIAFGSCLFVDVFYRLFYINDFYSDQGLLPREAVIGQFLGQWESSLLLISGRPEIIFFIMCCALVSISMLIVGYRTRLAAFVTWILITSIYTRAQIVLHGGDDLIRVMLFWCQFVPLGAQFSIDRYLNPPEEKSNTLLSFGGAGLTLQLVALYLFTAALKFHPVWIQEGSAVYYTLNLDQFTDTPGQWLLQFPQLMRMLTFSTLFLELVGPILILTPWLQRYCRIPVVLGFISFHFGLFVTLHLGPFPWTCMAAWLMILPESFWNFVKIETLAPIQKLGALFKKAKQTGEVLQIKPVGVSEAVAAVFIGLVLLWNLSHHESFNYKKTESFRILMNLTSMYQKWNMFAPYPRKDDGWYVIEAQLFNGQVVDPRAQDFVYSEEKPDDVAATYTNTMWRKYLSNIWLKTNHKYRIYFGRYLCRRWNNSKDSLSEERINTLKIYFMLEMTPKPGEPVEPVKKELIWRHHCFDKPADWA